MYCRYIYFIVVPLIMMANLAVAGPEERESAGEVRGIRNTEEALNKALAVSGFDELESFKGTELTADMVNVVSIKDSTTAFLCDSVNGRRAWRVRLPTVILDMKRAKRTVGRNAQSEYPIDFDIFLDSLTGQILKIETRSETGHTSHSHVPEASEGDRQIAGLGEAYHGLPDSDPGVSFLEALDKCKFYHLLAEKISAVYVMHSYSTLEDGPKPAWVITLSGLPNWSPHAGIPDYMVSNRRTIVDATTGARIYSTNLPYAAPLDSTKR